MLRQAGSQLRTGAEMGRSERPAITSINVYPDPVTIEDLYTDVLINIELPVISLYQQHPDLLATIGAGMGLERGLGILDEGVERIGHGRQLRECSGK